MNEADASAYSSDVVGYMLRKGCDGQAGSMLKIDACGVCGGKGECVACDGVPFSSEFLHFPSIYGFHSF